jgi:hypothetical protein
MARSNSSSVNYLSINENFPVAGQDNDTQVFRDNFDTIKTSLRSTKDELGDILTNAVYTDEDSDFNGNRINNAVLINSKMQFQDLGELSDGTTQTIDLAVANHFKMKLTGDINVDFLNFPGDPQLIVQDSDTVGKATIEFYSDGDTREVTFLTSGGAVIKKQTSVTGGWPTPFVADSATDPHVVEVWRHGQDVIFMHYLGQFI